MSRAGSVAAVAGLVAALAAVAAWQREPVAPSAAAVSLEGDVLFQAKGCATCHTGPGSVALTGSFPSLAEAPSWAGDRRPGLSAADYLAESIREPWAFTSPVFSAGGGGPAEAMPALALSEAEVEAIVGYLLAG